MKWWSNFPVSTVESAALLSLLLIPSPATAMLDCENIRVDSQSFNLAALKGPHSVVTSRHQPPTWANVTYTLDLCAPLKRKGDVPKGEGCLDGTRVCAIKHEINPDKPGKEGDLVSQVISIAGDLGGREFEYEATRLPPSDSNTDAKREGLRLVLKGGVYEGRDQSAVVELLCDKERTGTEDEWDPEDKYERRDVVADENGDQPHPEGEHQLTKGDNPPLIWNSYGPATDGSSSDVLRLTWRTKFACESVSGGEGSDGESKHWGFFTWVVILVFLATASYLIFGSWLNYTRYGARGWDLLPHGDTLRDVPYLFKDWTRRVLNTVQGSGSRGGYSAV